MLRTERLLLRRPTEADVELHGHLEQWKRNGVGKFVVERLEDGAVLGRVGVQLLDPQTWEPVVGAEGQPELGWTLRPEHRGRGYATEAARAVLEQYLDKRVVSLIPPDNLASQAVARRLGAVPADTVHLPGDGIYVVWEHTP